MNHNPQTPLQDPQRPESEWELIKSNHTRARPPHLKKSNFPAATLNGPIDETSTMHTHLAAEMEWLCLSGPRYTTTSDSGNTDSTLRVPDHLYPVLSREYGRDYDGAVHPLTEQAMRALNNEFSTHPCHGNLAAWIEQRQLSFGAQQPLDLSDSLVMPNGHPRTAPTTHGTLSSWEVVPKPDSHSCDLTAEDVCAAGGQFDDSLIPRNTNILEDLVKA